MRRLDTVYQEIGVAREVFNFPNINHNSTVSVDLAATSIDLGTHIISWAPESDARAFDDLIIQWMCVEDNIVRATLQNPTGGMIIPGTIACIFILGRVKAEVINTVALTNFPP